LARPLRAEITVALAAHQVLAPIYTLMVAVEAARGVQMQIIQVAVVEVPLESVR